MLIVLCYTVVVHSIVVVLSISGGYDEIKRQSLKQEKTEPPNLISVSVR